MFSASPRSSLPLFGGRASLIRYRVSPRSLAAGVAAGALLAWLVLMSAVGRGGSRGATAPASPLAALAAAAGASGITRRLPTHPLLSNFTAARRAAPVAVVRGGRAGASAPGTYLSLAGAQDASFWHSPPQLAAAQGGAPLATFVCEIPAGCVVLCYDSGRGEGWRSAVRGGVALG